MADAYSIAKLRLFLQLCAKYFPDKKVVLFSKQSQPLEQGSLGTLKVINWEFQERARLITPSARLFYRRGKYDETLVTAAAQAAFVMVDLGDHQATSEKATGFTANLLANLVFAKKFGLPYHFMPQSFGPFNYPPPFNHILRPMLKSILPYASCVNTREEWSTTALKSISNRIAIDQKPEFLLYSQLRQPKPQEVSNRMVYVPDQHTLNNQLALNEILDLCTRLAQSLAINETIMLVYDPADCRLAQKRTTPESWTVYYHPELESDIFEDLNDAIFISSKYHTVVHRLTRSQLTIYWQAHQIGKSLYSTLDLELLLTYNPSTFEKALALLKDSQANFALSSSTYFRIMELQASLPIFFSNSTANTGS